MIKTYLTFYLRFWLYSPILWVVSMSFLFLSGIFLNGFYFRLLGQHNEGQSISSEDGIIFPYLSVIALIVFLLSPAFIFFQKNLNFGSDNNFLRLIPYNTVKLIISQVFSSLGLILALLLVNFFSLLFLYSGLSVEVGVLLSNYCGMLIIALTLLSMSQFFMTWCTRFLHLFLAYFLILMLISFAEFLASSPDSLSGDVAKTVAPLYNYRLFKDGIIPLSESLRFLALSSLFIALSILRIEYRTKFRRHGRALLVSVLSCALFLLTMFGTYDIEVKHDASPFRHASIELLESLSEPLKTTVFTENKEVQQELTVAFNYFTRRSKNLSLQFKHPGLGEQSRMHQSDKVALMMQYQERKHYLYYPFTPSFDERFYNALEHLLQPNQLITFVKTKSSRSPFGDKVRDLTNFAASLEKQGFKLIELDLEAVQSIPTNSDLLIFSSPDTPLPTQKLQKIIDYIDNGGNFLWLREPNDELQHHQLSKYLGLQQKPGTLVDPEGLQRGSPHPAIVLVDKYETHKLTSTLKTLSALPFMSALTVQDNSNWQVNPLLKSNAKVWPDTSENFSESLENASNSAKAKAFNLILALESEHNSQRIIVAGGAHFLSDAVIHNYGNLALGNSIVSWLAQRSPMLSSTPPNIKSLAPTKLTNFLLIYFYPWLLPLVVFASGMLIVWKRYRRYGA